MRPVRNTRITGSGASSLTASASSTRRLWTRVSTSSARCAPLIRPKKRNLSMMIVTDTSEQIARGSIIHPPLPVCATWLNLLSCSFYFRIIRKCCCLPPDADIRLERAPGPARSRPVTARRVLHFTLKSQNVWYKAPDRRRMRRFAWPAGISNASTPSTADPANA